MMLMRHRFNEFPNPSHRFETDKNWTLFKDYKVPAEWEECIPNGCGCSRKDFYLDRNELLFR
jgi:hypothetical protein